MGYPPKVMVIHDTLPHIVMVQWKMGVSVSPILVAFHFEEFLTSLLWKNSCTTWDVKKPCKEWDKLILD